MERRIPPMLEYVKLDGPRPVKPIPTNKTVPMRDGTIKRWWTDGSLRRETLKAV